MAEKFYKYCVMKIRIFSLMELLVVIAIMVILASLLLPGLSKARDRVKATACSSNLKQLGNIVYFYAEDWQGYLPPYYDDKDVWQCILNNNVMEAKNFRGKEGTFWICPSNSFRKNISNMTSNYVMNACVTQQAPYYAQRVKYAARLGEEDSSRIPLITDGASYYFCCNSLDTRCAWPHSGGANYLFIDGHTDWYKKYVVLSGSYFGLPKDWKWNKYWNGSGF